MRIRYNVVVAHFGKPAKYTLGRQYKFSSFPLLVFKIFFISETACLSGYIGDLSTRTLLSVLRSSSGTVIVEYQQGFLNCGEYFAGTNSFSARVYVVSVLWSLTVVLMPLSCSNKDLEQ